MKNNFVLLCLVIIFTSFSFISCSDNDEDNSLVGTWKYGDDYDEVEYVTFFSDGIGYSYETCENHGLDIYKFEYVYNSKTGLIVIKDFYDDDTESGKVVSISNKQLVLCVDDDEYEIYTRTSGKYTRKELENYYQKYIDE